MFDRPHLHCALGAALLCCGACRATGAGPAAATTVAPARVGPGEVDPSQASGSLGDDDASVADPAGMPGETVGGGVGDTAARRHGLFTFYFENDIVALSDDEYTAGVGFSWVSADVNTFSEGNFLRRMVDAVDFLPTFDDPTRERYVSFILGQEIYTPEDISTPEPPPGQQPYAGILFLDTEVHARGPRSLNSWKLRLGIVGPSSLAEQSQTAIHKITGSDIPQGWDSQLHDEPLLNVDYRHDRRLYRSSDRPWAFDMTANSGAGVGNYYIGANVGFQVRGGFRLPDTYGPIALRSGAGGVVGLRPPSGGRWRAYAYLEGQLYGVARFLPTDGNTFQDSPSGPREDFPSVVTAGLVLGYGRLLVHYAFNNLGGFGEFPRTPSNDFGTLAVSYYFW